MASSTFLDSLSQGSTTKIQASRNSQDSYEKKVSDNRNYFLKMFMAELRHQDPTQPMDTQHITNTMASLTQAETNMESTQAINNIAKYFHKSMLTEAESYVGKNVSYDNSEQELQGDNIEFEYEVKCDKEKLPRDRQNITRITIKDDKSKVIYNKSLYSLEPGINKFKWDGVTNEGKIAEKMRKYKIEVQAGYTAKNANGQMEYMAVESNTSIRGKVSEAFRNSGNQVKLRVGNALVAVDDVSGLSESKDDEGKDSSASSENYMNYIGKKITVNQNSAPLRGGFAAIKFDNPLTQPGRVKIEILNASGGVESYAIKNDHVTLGQQNFTWDGKVCKSFEDLESMSAVEYHSLSKAKDGIYKYNIYIEDLSIGEPGNFQKIDTISEELITGVDFSNKASVKLMSKNGNYEPRDVQKIEMVTMDETSLALSAANYVGKSVTTIDNKMGISPDGNGALLFPLEALEDGFEYGNAYIKIYNDRGALLTTATKPASAISYMHKFPVPKFDELRNDARTYVTEYIRANSRYDNYDEIATDDAETQSKVQEFIKKEFYAGKIFTQEVDSADELEVSFMNMGLNKIVLENSKLPGGTYRYDLEVEVKDQKGRVARSAPINNVSKAMVLEARVDGGDVKLVLDNGKEIGVREVAGVGI